MPTAAEHEEPRQPPQRLKDPFSEWMLEVTVQLERLIARVAALEKSTDHNSTAVIGATAAATAAADAMARIAKAEEERLANDNDERRNRDAWMTRIWSSNAFQLLLVGLVIAVLNLFGISYLADRMIPAAPTQVQGPSDQEPR